MNEEVPRKGEVTQARILDAAYPLFMTQGYHGTSMRQIAERAGLTMGGVYNHFASKEDIWIGVLFERHPYRAILPVLRSIQSTTAEEYVRTAAYQLVGELNRHKDLLHIMFIELVEFNGAHVPALYEQIAPEVQTLLSIVHIDDARLRPISLPVLVRSFLGFFFSYYITEAMMPPSLRNMMGSNALDAFIDIYLYGVLAEGGASCEG
jgi:AcrR family transcriptional regulator